MLLGLCIVILAAASYFLKDKPAGTPGAPGAATPRTSQ